MISSPHLSSTRLPAVEHTLMKAWLLLMLAINSEVLMETFQDLHEAKPHPGAVHEPSGGEDSP